MYVLIEEDNWGVFAAVRETKELSFDIAKAIMREASCASIDIDLIDTKPETINWGEGHTYPVTCYDGQERWEVKVIVKRIVSY